MTEFYGGDFLALLLTPQLGAGFRNASEGGKGKKGTKKSNMGVRGVDRTK
jgi:hypothetical protein